MKVIENRKKESNSEVKKRTACAVWRPAMVTEMLYTFNGQGQIESQLDHKVPAEDQVITDNYN